ncbi:hypothetical protein [Pseudonocardia acidicola]|uniref:Uncharacterized protein n=1 Tax=Pseudonocardia acidicola TaxID=2724939 RepID=A0ABX1S9C2_9PSEU|nr:hypothetical protein [Pseudonocardia acidicola]NMH97514.1 hypothetical protein [Pseudonocardia acidicola]
MISRASSALSSPASRLRIRLAETSAPLPTEQVLLRAILKELLLQLREEADQLARDGDPATALFTLFTDPVAAPPPATPASTYWPMPARACPSTEPTAVSPQPC